MDTKTGQQRQSARVRVRERERSQRERALKNKKLSISPLPGIKVELVYGSVFARYSAICPGLPKRPGQIAEYLVNYVPYTNLCKHTTSSTLMPGKGDIDQHYTVHV